MVANVPILVALVAVYSLTSISGLALLKTNTDIFTPGFMLGVTLYGLSFSLWIFVILRMMPLSLAFPLATGALIVASQLVGWFALGEDPSWLQLGAVGAMLLGVGLLLLDYAARAAEAPAL